MDRADIEHLRVLYEPYGQLSDIQCMSGLS